MQNHESFTECWQSTAKWIDTEIRKEFEILFSQSSGSPTLLRFKEALSYATLGGGKRFRPVIALWAQDALGGDQKQIREFAIALEMVHAYSLVHDDLPSMDNDDFRRGEPTVHKKYDEALALLVGNALLTHAFTLITYAKSLTDAQKVDLVKVLSLAAGYNGMLGGQALDLDKSHRPQTLEELARLHEMKTGALIRAAVQGACVITEASEVQTRALDIYAKNLGLAFQIADDILDADKKEEVSFIKFLGLDGTKTKLKEVTNLAIQAAKEAKLKNNSLEQIAEYNLRREN